MNRKQLVRSALSSRLAVRTIGRVLLPRHPVLTVVAYHSVGGSPDIGALDPVSFRHQLEHLTDTAAPVTPAEFEYIVHHPASAPERAVLVTFDDGFADSIDVVAPILDELGIRGAFFVPTGLLDHDPTVVNRFARLHGAPPSEVTSMSWDDARALVAAGHVVGSHSVTHRSLAQIPTDAQLRELEESARRMRAEGIEPRWLAYPYGRPGTDVTRATVTLAAQVGYRFAFATHLRRVYEVDLQRPLLVPRVEPPTAADAAARQMLDDLVSGRWDLIGMSQQRLPAALVRRTDPAHTDPAKAD